MKRTRTELFPRTITVRDYPGISAKIYRQEREKRDKTGKLQVYTSYTLAYSLLGKRKLEAFTDFAEAEDAARHAIKSIAEGEQAKLELTSHARDIYLRAHEIARPFKVDLDVMAREWADTKLILNGIGTMTEAAHALVRARSTARPQISVPEAVKKCLEQCKAEKKSQERMHQLGHYLNGFAESMNVNVADLSTGIVSHYLTGLAASDRTKKNARDTIGFFGRWLVLHGYLERGANLLENVQRYSGRSGEIHIFTPAEIALLLSTAKKDLVPYIAIGAFAGLRGAEIQRLDWSEVEALEPKPKAKQQDFGWIEVKAEKSKTDVRRLVPIKANLAAWLKEHKKQNGPVCAFKNVVNELMDLVRAVNKTLPKGTPEKEQMAWKKNGLRHSYISYRVAECADIARVADESGNSPAIIKANYLKRVKPEQAKLWFDVQPA